MTTDIEKQFFETFGIEPKLTFYDLIRFSPKGWKVLECKDVYTYPEITDRILLELICILNTVTIPDLEDIKIDRLRKTILEECIVVLDVINTPTKEEFINNIRTLFKEER